MSFNLMNKVALVTGANRGIGKAIVESFLKHGASKVYLAVRNLDSVAELLKKYDERVVPVFVNLEQLDAIKSLAEQAPDVDIVVNNAGVLEMSGVLNADAEACLEKELNVNTFGLLRIAQIFGPVLEKNALNSGGSAFVQLNSVASMKNFAELTTYSASKAASYSITQGLKEAWESKGIQVLSVHPGPIKTDMAVQAGMEEVGEPTSVVSEGIVESLKQGEFHLFPDSVAKQFEVQYQSYAENIVEATLEEA